jgi:dTDP-4-dehydrorhamnose 3,5-epimerase
MRIEPLTIPGSFLIHGEPRRDDRGYFMRTFDDGILAKAGLATTFVQENQSRSLEKHTIRGLHFQAPPHAETKLIRVAKGTLLDVFVDLRVGSPTYGKFEAIELSEDNLLQLWIPRGCAHGFCTLSRDVVIIYKVDSYYTPTAEGGLRWNDPSLEIPWPTAAPILSEKDMKQPFLRDLKSPFLF